MIYLNPSHSFISYNSICCNDISWCILFKSWDWSDGLTSIGLFWYSVQYSIPRADIALCFARCTNTVHRVQWTRPDPRYIDANAGPRQRTMGTEQCPSHRLLVTASGSSNSPEGTHSRVERRERGCPSVETGIGRS